MPIIISGDPTKSISLTGDQSKSIQASQVYVPPPAYVIPGLTQSHWLAANAVTSNGTTITSITDTSGVSNLVGYSFYEGGQWGQPARRIYEPSGWTSNGKTIPSFRVTGATLRSSEWPGILSGLDKPFTFAMLVEHLSMPRGYSGYNEYGTVAGLVAQPDMYGNNSNYLSVMEGGYIYKRGTLNGSGYGSISGDYGSLNFKRAIVMRFDPTNGFSVWRNGVKYNFTQGFPMTNLNTTYVSFTLGALFTGGDVYQKASDCRFAEFHIYSGNLNDTQCVTISDYLRDRGGV